VSHSPHHAHPAYSPDQVLYDGCAECGHRASMSDHGALHLDIDTFERAWHRAARWQLSGLNDVSQNEIPLFRMLTAVMIQFERRGILFGALPRNVLAVSPVLDAAPGLMDAYSESQGEVWR
jgi:hypothetical protein